MAMLLRNTWQQVPSLFSFFFHLESSSAPLQFYISVVLVWASFEPTTAWWNHIFCRGAYKSISWKLFWLEIFWPSNSIEKFKVLCLRCFFFLNRWTHLLNCTIKTVPIKIISLAMILLSNLYVYNNSFEHQFVGLDGTTTNTKLVLFLTEPHRSRTP